MLTKFFNPLLLFYKIHVLSGLHYWKRSKRTMLLFRVNIEINVSLQRFSRIASV